MSDAPQDSNQSAPTDFSFCDDNGNPVQVAGTGRRNVSIATRYDRLATIYLAAVCLAATINYWL